MATKEYFPGIGKIKFEGKESMNPMAFRYYDAEKVIMGKKMKDWLKFAMAWWHTLCAEDGTVHADRSPLHTGGGFYRLCAGVAVLFRNRRVTGSARKTHKKGEPTALLFVCRRCI